MKITYNPTEEYPYTIYKSKQTEYKCKEVPVPNTNYSKFVTPDNEVGIIYSPGFGAGWSTWEMKENRNRMIKDTRIIKYLYKLEYVDYSYDDFMTMIGFENPPYDGGFNSLNLEFVPEGSLFKIREYDGSEYVEVFDPRTFMTA